MGSCSIALSGGLLLSTRNARKPAREARPNTSAGCLRVKSDAVRMRSPTLWSRRSCENFLRAVRRVAHEAGELRRVLVETLGGGASGLHHVIDHVGTGGNLHVEKTLRLFARI